MDLGLERAGWRTVSFSEIDPYASAVLAERWPGVPNLGDIVQLQRPGLRTGADSEHLRADGSGDWTSAVLAERWPGVPNLGDIAGLATEHPPVPWSTTRRLDAATDTGEHDGGDWTDATLWTGGFPCQDLSVAGKRKGLAGERSGLAFAFLDLVERYRPECLVLENVPGLLSSHAGRDLGTLLGRLVELRYGWAFRVLDAQWFGVPQRRRRVFILALDLERHPDEFSAAEVLAVGSRCRRNHQAEREAWAGSAAGTERSVGFTSEGINSTIDDGAVVVDGAPPYADRMRAPDGLARRLDGGTGVEADAGIVTSLTGGLGSGGPDAAHAQAGWLVPFVKAGRAQSAEGVERESARPRDATDPLGLDSHRYRCAGNGVVAPVAEWLGMRLRRYLEGEL